MIAVVSGLLLVFATLVLLYRRFLSPLVNMSSLCWRRSAGCWAAVTGMEISMPVYIGLLMLLGIVAKTRSCSSISRSRRWTRVEQDPRCSMPGASARNRRHDDSRDGRGHGADGSRCRATARGAPMGVVVIGG